MSSFGSHRSQSKLASNMDANITEPHRSYTCRSPLISTTPQERQTAVRQSSQDDDRSRTGFSCSKAAWQSTVAVRETSSQTRALDVAKKYTRSAALLSEVLSRKRLLLGKEVASKTPPQPKKEVTPRVDRCFFSAGGVDLRPSITWKICPTWTP